MVSHIEANTVLHALEFLIETGALRFKIELKPENMDTCSVIYPVVSVVIYDDEVPFKYEFPGDPLTLSM